jgi:NAD(P)-dependent dehydrogenase (short-subunit alcohol dehydrogenase family)
MTARTHAGKTALVTGGTAGIGFHISAALARLGMRVLVTGRDPDRAQAALAQLRLHAGHDNAPALLADGASIRENIGLAQEVERRVGRLDVLVNHGGGGASAERRETPETRANLRLQVVEVFGLDLPNAHAVVGQLPTQRQRLQHQGAHHALDRRPAAQAEAHLQQREGREASIAAHRADR